MTPLRRRTVIPIRPGVRLVLEVDTPELHPLTSRFLRHIDRVRTLLAAGRVSPDDAHALLVDCSWVGRA